MTQSVKDRVVTGVIVGIMMIIIQLVFTAFSGRWSKGNPINDFVEKKQYVVDREGDLKKAFGYTDNCIEDLNESYEKDKENISQKIKNVENIQSVQIESMKSDIGFIKEWVLKQ